MARVRLASGTGKVTINGRSLENYFPLETQRNDVLLPLNLTDMFGKLDVRVNVCGGGSTGQAGACLLYTSPSPRDLSTSRMPSSA